MSSRTGSAGTPASRSSPVTARGPTARPSAPRCRTRCSAATAGTCGICLAEAAAKEVAAHSACWAEGAPLQEGKRAETTLERWQQVHDLRSQGVGLLDCSRRLGLALNTVKRYDRADEPERLRRAAQYRPTTRRPLPRLPAQTPHTRNPGSRCSSCCGRSASAATRAAPTCWSATSTRDAPTPSGRTSRPARPTQILLTRPDNLPDEQRETAGRLSAACPEMKALASLIGNFAAMLDPDPANEDKLLQWIADARAADLPHLHSFTRGLDLDIKAATAALTLPHHNGRTEGVNNKTKMIKRQMFGRAGFDLLRHRILLG